MASTTGAGTTITARANALGSTPWSKSCGCCRSWCAVLLSQCRCFEHCRSSCAPPPVQVLPLLQKLVRCTASTSAGAATTTRVGAMYFSQRSRCCGPCRRRCDVLHWSRGTFLPLAPSCEARDDWHLSLFNVLLRTKMKIKIRSLSNLIQTSNGARSQLKTQSRRHHHIKTHPTACPLHSRCDAHTLQMFAPNKTHFQLSDLHDLCFESL